MCYGNGPRLLPSIFNAACPAYHGHELYPSSAVVSPATRRADLPARCRSVPTRPPTPQSCPEVPQVGLNPSPSCVRASPSSSSGSVLQVVSDLPVLSAVGPTPPGPDFQVAYRDPALHPSPRTSHLTRIPALSVVCPTPTVLSDPILWSFHTSRGGGRWRGPGSVCDFTPNSVRDLPRPLPFPPDPQEVWSQSISPRPYLSLVPVRVSGVRQEKK